MPAIYNDYGYQKPQNTWTIDQYISCKSDTTMNYHNMSFVDNRDNIAYDTYNVLTDYIDEIRSEYCVTVKLSDKDMEKYRYRPKLLCFDFYGNGELAFIIMAINDMCSVKEFTKNKIYMLSKAKMNTLVRYLSNANKSAIRTYNAHNNPSTY